MRATVNLDDALVSQAQALSGVRERGALPREALNALILFPAVAGAVGAGLPAIERGHSRASPLLRVTFPLTLRVKRTITGHAFAHAAFERFAYDQPRFPG